MCDHREPVAWPGPGVGARTRETGHRLTGTGNRPQTAEQLAEAIAALAGLDPAERARAARQLIEDAKAVLSGVRWDAIDELLTTRTYQQAADEVGVSVAAINAAITKRRAALAAAAPGGGAGARVASRRGRRKRSLAAT